MRGLDALWTRADDEAVADNYVRDRFGVEPAADPSGLLGGEPVDATGGAPAEPDEDAQFEAYMTAHFPQAAGSTP